MSVVCPNTFTGRKNQNFVYDILFLQFLNSPKSGEVTGEWTMNSFIISIHPKYHKADQIKDNEVGGTCGTHGRGEKIVQGFGGKLRRKETHLEDQGVDGRMESEWIFGRLARGV
jgi:hypothetical protein